ncbi:hypothetical protein GCK72_024012 [Caenorhabditis remanei]|uniref:SPK domain-containing protein n=1 Tax=Caenorhabditis remanei TaxID=31234 RepID=A0A6A5FYC5_CAERE|nr:hypothetical protein GCK72_024012 [Caenorhabditis remanei]KAF1747547.1 hypothetical protein GCK72_024012 [Caenorhabditis remanei]
MNKDKLSIRAPRRCVAKKTIKYKESDEEEEKKKSMKKNVWLCVDNAFPGLTAESSWNLMQGEIEFLKKSVITNNEIAQTKLMSALKKITKKFEKKMQMVTFLLEFKMICGKLVRRCADIQNNGEIFKLMIAELPTRINSVYKMTQRPVESWEKPRKIACKLLEIRSVDTDARPAKKKNHDDSLPVENQLHEIQSFNHSMMEDLSVDGTPEKEMETNVIAQPEIDMDYTEPAPKKQKMSTCSKDFCNKKRKGSFGIGQPLAFEIPSIEQFPSNSDQEGLPSPIVDHGSSNMQHKNSQIFPEASLAEVHLPLLQQESLADQFEIEVQQMAPHHADNGNNMEHREEEVVEEENLQNAGEVFLDVENGDGFENDEELVDDNEEELETENEEDLEDESDEEMDPEMEAALGLLALKDPQYLKRLN